MSTATSWHIRMSPRAPSEAHRASTPLELFFNLCFVVAVASAGASLHHALAGGRFGPRTLGFVLVFFAIWWAWMNFSWFASAYDTDDVPYRLAVLVQIAGALILAAGVPRLFDDHDATIVTLGYVVMRLAMVAQWLRAAACDPARRAGNLRYAAGITLVQIAWVLRLALPAGWWLGSFLVLVIAELAVPMWAERHGATSWHPGHIAERYGLFTIIVLGETVLAASVGVRDAVDAGSFDADIAANAAGGLLVVFALWWIYFDLPAEAVIERANAVFVADRRAAFVWGYGHLVVFASAAAVGSGLQVVFDQVTGNTGLSTAQAAACVAVPVVVYVLSLWLLHFGQKPPGPMRTLAPPLAAAAVVASIWSPQPVLTAGIVLALAVAAMVVAGAGASETTVLER